MNDPLFYVYGWCKYISTSFLLLYFSYIYTMIIFLPDKNCVRLVLVLCFVVVLCIVWCILMCLVGCMYWSESCLCIGHIYNYMYWSEGCLLVDFLCCAFIPCWSIIDPNLVLDIRYIKYICTQLDKSNMYGFIDPNFIHTQNDRPSSQSHITGKLLKNDKDWFFLPYLDK